MRHPENTICADARMRATRVGDSGGPLMINRKGTWFQVGIVSEGDDVSNRGFYSRVTAYCNWIKKETKGAVECTPPPK
ncbi:tryptase-like protein [Aphelenchoides avenae]|nr:tryptase-like protein [Aphelenchus avenae]